MRSERGTASVEIVVMLPLFIVLFAGIYYLHAAGSAAITSLERARGCAWQFAVGGCQDSAKSTGLCSGVTASKADDIEKDAPELGAQTVFDKIEAIPILGPLVQKLFGEGAVAAAEEEAPRLMEEGTHTLHGNYYMICNTVPKTWGDLLKDQVCGILQGSFGADGTLLGCK